MVFDHQGGEGGSAKTKSLLRFEEFKKKFQHLVVLICEETVGWACLYNHLTILYRFEL